MPVGASSTMAPPPIPLFSVNTKPASSSGGSFPKFSFTAGLSATPFPAYGQAAQQPLSAFGAPPPRPLFVSNSPSLGGPADAEGPAGSQAQRPSAAGLLGRRKVNSSRAAATRSKEAEAAEMAAIAAAPNKSKEEEEEEEYKKELIDEFGIAVQRIFRWGSGCWWWSDGGPGRAPARHGRADGGAGWRPTAGRSRCGRWRRRCSR
ncbi:hypothetical protein DFJ74DRAFT_690158 [Hyaloraphidium curvatum]|nr:hypothetical protein DFJ74DRAFT_690158 [Hyaloraphidium curvatum]